MRLVVSPFEKGGLNVEPCYHVTKERIKKYYPLDLMAMCKEAGRQNSSTMGWPAMSFW